MLYEVENHCFCNTIQCVTKENLRQRGRGGAIKGLLIISTLGSVLLAKDLPTQLTQLDHHGDK